MQADIEDPEVIRSLGARNLDGVVVAVADDMEASIMAVSYTHLDVYKRQIIMKF